MEMIKTMNNPRDIKKRYHVFTNLGSYYTSWENKKYFNSCLTMPDWDECESSIITLSLKLCSYTKNKKTSILTTD